MLSVSPSNVIVRPSKASTWVRCAGHLSLAADGPDWHDDDEDVAVREEGTAAHWLAHQLSQGLAPGLGTAAPNAVALTEEMFEGVDLYFDAVRDWGVSNAWFEMAVQCKRVHPLCVGTLDVGAYDPARKCIFIGDFKFGYRFVDVRNNWQMLCYATGLQHHLGILSDVDLWFEFLIVQPRSYHRDGPVRRWRVHATEVRALINQLSTAAHAALMPEPLCTVNPGCGRCEGRHKCETLQIAALEGLDVSESATPHDLPFAAAEDELRRLQRARDVIDARVTGLEQQVIYAMKRGAASRYFAAEAAPGRLAWKPESEPVVRNLATLLRANITKEKLITPTQAEKILPPALVAAHSYRPPGAVKLVPVETSRLGRLFGK